MRLLADTDGRQQNQQEVTLHSILELMKYKIAKFWQKKKNTCKNKVCMVAYFCAFGNGAKYQN